MAWKFAIVIPDGAADEPQEALGGQTPLAAASLPNIQRAAQQGIVGEAFNVPEPFVPGSDVATLSLLGYDPAQYYTGRAPLEAAAQGIKLGPHDWAVRCNLVTILDGRMVDFSAGHITNEEARTLIEFLQQEIGSDTVEFRPGVSYRNLLLLRGSPGAPVPLSERTETTPPHEIPDQPVESHWPRGDGAELLKNLMDRSAELLATHPINERRRREGKHPATQVWLWGQGRAPALPSFVELHGVRGAMITAVDLLRGIAALIGWDRLEVEGATGYLDTNYAGKGQAAVDALRDYDLVCVHIEAPDEASHEGLVTEKVRALEQIDRWIVGPLLEALADYEQWRLLVSPDHPTPLRTRRHDRGYVPWLITGTGVPCGGQSYHEETARRSGRRFPRGHELMGFFLSPSIR